MGAAVLFWLNRYMTAFYLAGIFAKAFVTSDEVSYAPLENQSITDFTVGRGEMNPEYISARCSESRSCALFVQANAGVEYSLPLVSAGERDESRLIAIDLLIHLHSP